jgi:hypothetical protein
VNARALAGCTTSDFACLGQCSQAQKRVIGRDVGLKKCFYCWHVYAAVENESKYILCGSFSFYSSEPQYRGAGVNCGSLFPYSSAVMFWEGLETCHTLCQ